MFEKFTDRARRAVVLAGEFASKYNSTHLTTGHLLMGLLTEREALPVGVLQALGITEPTASPIVQGLLAESWVSEEPTAHPAWTEAAKLALERSQQEAYKLNVGYIAPEHILLGLLSSAEKPFRRLDDRIFETILVQLGTNVQQVRESMLHAIKVADQAEADARLSATLGSTMASPTLPTPKTPPDRREVTVEVTVRETYSVPVLEGDDDLDIMNKGLAAARTRVRGTGRIIGCSARIEETDV